MKAYDTSIMSDELPDQLVGVLTDITDKELMCSFLRDVMTEKEILEISARLEAAKMLVRKQPYTAITQRTKLSSRTVARISDWLQNGCGGYASIISGAHHTHLSPELTDS